jgi:aldehyde:ferredoxin oxidoreductase
MAGGFMGKYLIVDLTSGRTEEVEPGEDFYRAYLGGYGLGAAVILERQPAGIDPLAPESYLGFCSGLLTGAGPYFSGRFMVTGKSPLTGGWGDANAGGFFSRELKRTGYDAVFVTGRAETPVWVWVTNGEVQIRDASDLWGLDIAGTESAIRDGLGDNRAQIASIGPAGEKLSLISGVATDGARIAARSGLGAVMGAKNLKAIALRGRAKVVVSRPDELKTINEAFRESYRKSSFADRMTLRLMGPLSRIIASTGIAVPAQPSLVREIYRKYGTSGLTLYSAMVGDMPIQNWTGVGHIDYTYKSAQKCSDEQVLSYQKRRYACQGCPLGCGGIIDIRKGTFQGEKGHKPEYETISAFGGLLLQDDLDAIIEINEMCNRAGLDTISAGGAAAFAIQCFQDGRIDENDTGGLRLRWGDSHAIIRLVELMIKREGIGDILADGVQKAARRIGRGSEIHAVHAGGQELPMHDSRLDPGFAIAYECEPTPGRHTISCYLYAGLFGVTKRFPAARSRVKAARGRQEKDVARYTAGSYYMQLVNCAGFCLFGAITSALPVTEYINAVTGWGLSADEYFRTGERILNLRKAFNQREGVTQANHSVNPRALGNPPLPAGPLKGKTIDMENLRAAFYRGAGWDLKTGGPTPEKLAELGIDHLAS